MKVYEGGKINTQETVIKQFVGEVQKIFVLEGGCIIGGNFAMSLGMSQNLWKGGGGIKNCVKNLTCFKMIQYVQSVN